MIGRKVTVVSAVLATLASSAIGATAVRSPEAGALTVGGVTQVVEDAQKELDDVASTTIDLTKPAATGVGETLVLVVAAQVPVAEGGRKLAEVNNRFGEIEGFSLDGTDNYEPTGAFTQVSVDVVEVPCAADDCPDGLTTVKEFQPVELEFVPLDATGSLGTIEQTIGTAASLERGLSLIVTGFRTKRGAEQFIELARALGVTDLVTIQARKIGGGDIGLGQEPHPDGSGPLLEPLPDAELYQR